MPYPSMSRLKIPLILAAAAVLTRLPFTSRFLYNIDSVQFALGSEHFDVALHQPHPPGYFLYVMLGRLIRLLIPDANSAFVVISVAASALAVVAVYYLAREVFDENTGLAAAVIALTSPLMWFHGEVALSYMPEAFMSALFALISFKMLKGETRLWWLAAVVLAVAGGIRQNTMVFLMPLWFYSVRGIGLRKVVLSFVIFGAAVFAWFVPMLALTGGYERYHAALSAHWYDANWHGISLSWTAFNAYWMFCFLMSGLAFGLVPIISYIYSNLRRRPLKTEILRFAQNDTAFFLFWLLPPFLFHLLVFTHPAVPGHSLIYQVGLFVLAAKALTAVSAASERQRRVLLTLAAIGNIAIFLFDPYPLSARGIRAHDQLLSAYIKTVRANFSPADTEIIGAGRFIFNARHAMYYLPEYRVFNRELITTPEGPRLFWSEGRVTHRARYISLKASTSHVVSFLDYGPDDYVSFPPGAKFLPVLDGHYLVHYESGAVLHNVKGIAPYLDPAMKWR